MKGVGNTAGAVGKGVSSAGNAVGAGAVQDGAGSVVTGAGGAIGGAATSIGATPEHVAVLGGAKVNPVSTALQCTINLTIQYLGIYTAIAILRVVADFMGQNSKSWTVGEALDNAVVTVNYAPMLAIMFLACRMRVTWLTQAKGSPPTWMQAWMYYATFSVLALTLVALVVPLLTGEKAKFNDKGDIDEEHQPFKNWLA